MKEVAVSDTHLTLKLSLRVYQYSGTIPCLGQGPVDDFPTPPCVLPADL